jgi:methylmalonyl-CoA/ethylmalonyl-CoA epimerase
MDDQPCLDHIGIAVRDLDAAMKTFSQLLGCDIDAPEVLEARGIAVAFVGNQTPRIELLGPIRADNELTSFLTKRGEGIHHLCVRVHDIEKSVLELQARGARITAGGIRAGAHQSRVAFIHPKDTHGVLLELLEQNSPPTPASPKQPS